jgi:hypothetical protein
MTPLFKVEDVFETSGRGCVIMPSVPVLSDFKIRLKDPTGRGLPIRARIDDWRKIASLILSAKGVNHRAHKGFSGDP